MLESGNKCELKCTLADNQVCVVRLIRFNVITRLFVVLLTIHLTNPSYSSSSDAPMLVENDDFPHDLHLDLHAEPSMLLPCKCWQDPLLWQVIYKVAA